ncbi:MAG TPA: CRISPR-associated protein Cas4 [Candidatus Scatovivens faecipullorum]|mgnify:CR=1 FL=1|nr:CRISPR-associated protein Cas4 [Candidatus Scatovivens faecipullorum]
MKVTGTIINYYFHCKRQCYLFANRINLEDNSEDVRVGKILHEIKAKDGSNTEIKYEDMVIDKITSKYIEEYKKSDSDTEASKMQLLFYLKNLKEKGIEKEGKLIYHEKNKKENNKTEIIKLDEKNLKELENCINEIEILVNQKEVPKVENTKKCKKCAYYEYCYL